MQSGRSFEDIIKNYSVRQLMSLYHYENWLLKQRSKDDIRLAHILDSMNVYWGSKKKISFDKFIIDWKKLFTKKKVLEEEEQDPERSKAIWLNWLGTDVKPKK